MKHLLITALLACSAQLSAAPYADPPSIGAFQYIAQELPVGFVKCAAENQRCEFKGRAWVFFGSAFAGWSPSKTFVDGVACTVEVFGGPAGSSCYMMPVSAKWPQMLPLPSGLALLNEPLSPPTTNPALCLLAGQGGTGPMGLHGMLPSGYAQARWCRTANGWAGFFVVQDRHYVGPPLEVKWLEALPAPAITGSAVLTWAAPTTRGDGTPLTNLAGYVIKYGLERGRPSRMMAVDDPKATKAEINWLTAGVWWFAVTAFDSEGTESAPSYEISKTIVLTPPVLPPPPPSAGRTFYLQDYQFAAAPAGCAPGSGTNDGLTPATPKQIWAQLPALNGGDTIHFARGSSWDNASMRITVTTATKDNPVRWTSYTPPCGGTAAPILREPRETMALFNFDDGGTMIADGGYIISGLDLRGGGVWGVSPGARAGIFLNNRVDNVTVEDVKITGFAIGVQSHNRPHATTRAWENFNLTIKRVEFRDIAGFSFLGGANGLLIEDSIFDRNGTKAIYDHPLYFSHLTNGVIRGNTFTRNVPAADGKCTASVIVGHGGNENLLIERNKIINREGALGFCVGIEIGPGYADADGAEYFRNVQVVDNLVLDGGARGIAVRACSNCTIKRNRLIWDKYAGDIKAIGQSFNVPSALDDIGNGVTIEDNEIFMDTGTSAVQLLAEGTRHRVARNRAVVRKLTGKCVDTQPNATVEATTCTIDAAAVQPTEASGYKLPPPPPPPPPPPIVATWVVAATPTYPVTFTRSATGAIVWARSKVAGGGRATIGSSCDCSLTILEGANRYCRYSPMANDVALCTPKMSTPGGAAAIR